MQKIVIVGAGINGLVAANYLARAGFDVTILERKDHPGGACCAGIWENEGKKYEYPQGASVLGFMEDFIFEQTGLSKKVKVFRPEHPEIIWAASFAKPLLIWDDTEQMIKEAKENFGEKGDIRKFFEEHEKVVAFLRQGYRKAEVPTLQSATAALGPEIVSRWITGSARDLLNYFLTSEPLKLFFAVDVIESGPVSLDAPYSAFSIPLMGSGSIFGGEWGYVLGGIWQIPLQLKALNDELGIKTILNAKVNELSKASDKDIIIHYEVGAGSANTGSKEETILADKVIFATDPLTAAKISGDKKLLEKISNERLVGTSGKLVMFFSKAVQWKNDTGMKDFDSAFRHIIPVRNLTEFEEASNAVSPWSEEFTPGYFEIYCEGAGNRALGGNRDYELVSVFFKNLAFSKTGEELPEIKRQVEEFILAKISNREDLLHTILETPKDIANMFFFPGGNIDDVDLASGQTFFQRNYSSDPSANFYQFGSDPRIFYCAAGAYPCGSVAGTPGYICARQIIERER
jgi:phytoene dehydrogenase-like protein